MTHKDFVLIAGALAESFRRASEQPALLPGLTDALAEITTALRTTNPRFDRERFIAAAKGMPITGRDKVRE